MVLDEVFFSDSHYGEVPALGPVGCHCTGSASRLDPATPAQTGDALLILHHVMINDKNERMHDSTSTEHPSITNGNSYSGSCFTYVLIY